MLRNFSAISLTYNMSMICCNSHDKKTYWKCIHLLHVDQRDDNIPLIIWILWQSNKKSGQGDEACPINKVGA